MILSKKRTKHTSDACKRSTVVCVTDQYSCERLIKAGRTLADISGTRLLVINVSNPDLSKCDTTALEALFSASKEYGAVMNVYYSLDPLKTIGSCIKSEKAANVITGMPQNSNSILSKLWGKFTSVNFFTVDNKGKIEEKGISENSSAIA